jgi:hypothetical protein
MWLPTRAQVDAASRHAITIAGTAVVIFGLQAKGVSVDQVTAAIQALGDSVNTLVTLLGAAGALYAAIKAGNSASPTNQIASTAALAVDPTQPQAEAAKQALIAATISLPEVKTIVTDKQTADAAPSGDVVPDDKVKVINNASGEDINK